MKYIARRTRTQGFSNIYRNRLFDEKLDPIKYPSFKADNYHELVLKKKTFFFMKKNKFFILKEKTLVIVEAGSKNKLGLDREKILKHYYKIEETE